MASTITTNAGSELGVASTKAFTAHLTALLSLALYLAQVRGTVSDATELSLSPGKLETVLRSVDDACHELAESFFIARDFLFLGRDINYPIALDGNLKLKELCYTHVEGYPAGGMKHGPYALIDETLPCVVITTKDPQDPPRCSYMKRPQQHPGRPCALRGHQLVEHALYIP